MKPVYQTIFSPPLGNCFQACLASILELELGEVPNFMEYGEMWFDECQHWLEINFGLNLLSLDADQAWKPTGWHLMSVKSPRGEWLHSLVGFDSIPVHDPYPSGNCEHRGIERVEVFCVLDPTNCTRRTN